MFLSMPHVPLWQFWVNDGSSTLFSPLLSTLCGETNFSCCMRIHFCSLFNVGSIFFYVEHLYLLGSRSKFYKKRTPIWIHSKIVQHSWILHLIASYYGKVWAYIKHVSCLKYEWQTPSFLRWLLNQWLLNTWRVLFPSPFFCDKRYQISFYKCIKYLWSSLLLNVHCNCH